MSQPEYEHRVVKHFPTGEPVVGPAPDAAKAGEDWRYLAGKRLPGEHVEIQRREVGPWEVRRTTKPDPGGAS